MKVPNSPFTTRLSGSAKETELRLRSIFQWKKKRPPVVLFVLTALAVLLCFGLVSCETAQPQWEEETPMVENQKPDSPLTEEDSLPEEPEPSTEIEAEQDVETDTYTLENLNLDGSGGSDDSLAITVVRHQGWGEGYVSLTARLGTGQELEHEVMKGKYYCQSHHAAYLTSTEHQTVVLELYPWGVNSNCAYDILLEVLDGSVKEVCRLTCDGSEDGLNTQSAMWGLEVKDQEDSPLQMLRVPTSVGKWHGPELGTLTWENDQWKFVLDGYYTDDWYWAVVDGGMELTLSLRGRINRDIPSYPVYYYDQIQILHGDTVVQTITEDSFTPDDHCPFELFNADAPNKSVYVKDINFDGNEDFGISCNRYHNDGYCWFLYDPQIRQFRYAFSLSGEPMLNSDKKLVFEKWQDDYGENVTYNTYEYDEQDKLILSESRKEIE